METTVPSPSGRKTAKPTCPGTPDSPRAVTLVDHDGVLRSEKILDSRIDRGRTQHHLVRGGGVHGGGGGHRGTFHVDTATNAAERKCHPPQGVTAAFMNLGRMA